MMLNPKYEKLYIILFFAILTVILTWPTAWHFFSSVPSSGSDTMQVIGVAGDKANLLNDEGLIKGTWQLIERSEFNITLLYAYFQLIFGRIAGYNLLFFLSFILSGFGTYLLANYFIKNKPASLIAGLIFAFSPFHFHNALSTNVGTMHQEWLPFFALYLFRFFDPIRKKIGKYGQAVETSNFSNGFDDFKLKNFALAGFFLVLIGFTEHQLLAFTAIFILFFLIYKLIAQPKVFLRPKLWLYVAFSALVLSLVFFFMFRSLFIIANSGDNYLDAGFKSAVGYSNDSMSIFVPPSSHSLWPNALSSIRNEFRRGADSKFSAYAGYSVLMLTLFAIAGLGLYKKKQLPIKGIFFWLAIAVGFYVLSLGPYLHYKGVINPPVKMPYYLVYQYFPYYKNIRTVGRLFVWSMLGFAMLAAWGITLLNAYIQKKYNGKNKEDASNQSVGSEELGKQKKLTLRSKILHVSIGLIVSIEFLAVPIKTNSLLHSSFYEKLGQDKEKYSVLEVPGSTSYSFASRDLVWKSIHRKNTVNGYDFARVTSDHYSFQRGTPIIRTLLYDIPGGSNGNDRDIMKNSYYSISSEILNYYNIRYIILDKEGLKGKPEEGDLNMLYPAKAYISNVIKCADEYEDNYLYACKIDQSAIPSRLFLAMDYTNKHWVGKSESKNGLQRWAENGAGLKLINMKSAGQSGKISFNLKIEKPLRLKVFLNGEEVYSKYFSVVGQRQEISANLTNIKPQENEIVFGVFAADGSEIHSEKKSDTARIYQVQVD